MPVSKRRKTAAKKQDRRTPAVPEKKTKFAIKLNGSRLANLKNDPDFLTMIKIGRAMNAVIYALVDVLAYQSLNTALGKRQHRRACFVLGGYLHQSIKLVLAVKGRYLTEPGFEPLRKIVLDTGDKKARDYVRKMRNFTAFHLDEYDETTRQTLFKLKPTTYTLISGDDLTATSYYFEFSDHIDMTFLVDTFANGRSWEETTEDIFTTINDLAYKFLQACHDFQRTLCEKVKIGEHIYR